MPQFGAPVPPAQPSSERGTLLAWALGALAFLASLVAVLLGLILLNSIHPGVGALLFILGAAGVIVTAASGLHAAIWGRRRT
jgi:hypothetical protein